MLLVIVWHQTDDKPLSEYHFTGALVYDNIAMNHRYQITKCSTNSAQGPEASGIHQNIKFAWRDQCLQLKTMSFYVCMKLNVSLEIHIIDSEPWSVSQRRASQATQQQEHNVRFQIGKCVSHIMLSAYQPNCLIVYSASTAGIV